MKPRKWLFELGLGSILSICLAAHPCKSQAVKQTHVFAQQGDHFVLDGKPFQIVAGEMHYARIPRQYWRQRMQMAKAMGLNTIATYVFWNVHEPQPGMYNFTDDADLAAFLKTAQQEGLYVLLRAGPYACAEWEFGGFPAWLLRDPTMSKVLRSNDPAFMQPVQRWMTRLGREVGEYQIENGGPILATQIENEYGNFSNDHGYMQHMREVLLQAGFTKSLLYTVDPSKALANGEIEGVVSGVNFGSGRAADALAVLAKQRPGAPLFASEYWPGWFDLWGRPHETRPTPPQVADLDYILSHGASLNLYMFHGGTSFGMMAGASQSTGSYRGNVTSYDYDAPLDEAGHVTPKFFAFRDVILKHTGASITAVPDAPPVIAIAPFSLLPAASLWDRLPEAVASEQPKTMEELGQAYGYILYRKQLDHAMKDELLELDHPYDYAQVYLDGSLVGTLDRHASQTSLRLNSVKAARLDILIENSGRLNSTRAMRDERKGMRGAKLAGSPLLGWQIFTLPMDSLSGLQAVKQKTETISAGPHFSVGSFDLRQTGDMFLDTRPLGKGLVWVNGHPLGRVWNIGPQNTLYVPGPWLRAGRNTVVVFDLFAARAKVQLQGLREPLLAGPTPTWNDDPERQKKPADNGEFGVKLTTPADAPSKKEP